METTSTSTPSCNTCHKLQTDLPQPLKHCAKCQTTKYCSRECQKADWKNHKILCVLQAAARQGAADAASSSTGPHNPGFNVMNGLYGGAIGTKLQGLPEKDAFIELIDCFRMRMEDEYIFGGNNFGIYGDDDPLPVFRKFLDLAEKRQGLLPTWWNKQKRRECERLATGGDPWADISCCVEKSDIQEHYGDGTKPMMLRILGEKIYGKGFM
jgi:mitochondrial splicing suppressor protein 51